MFLVQKHYIIFKYRNISSSRAELGTFGIFLFYQ